MFHPLLHQPGHFDPQNSELFDSVCLLLYILKQPFIIGGDLQTPPSRLREAEWLRLLPEIGSITSVGCLE